MRLANVLVYHSFKIYTHEALMNQFDVLQELVTNDLRYDSRSAFTLSLNHRDTYTGITDKDRSLTTKRFAELTNQVFENNITKKRQKGYLARNLELRSHTCLSRNRRGSFSKSRSYRLAVGLARLSNVTPVVIGAEMLQPDGDLALSVEDAKQWASEEYRSSKALTSSSALNN